MKNDYYSIAMEDLLYVQTTLNTEFYNNISIMCQQISEKLLKSVAELECTDIDKLMQSHNLRALYTEIRKVRSDFILDPKELSMLKDYYYDAKYPGDNFVVVDKISCEENLQVMYNVLKEVTEYREKENLEVILYNEKYLDN